MSKNNTETAKAGSSELLGQEIQAPPGTIIVKSGATQKGDWFYIEKLRMWAPVPECGWGEPILNSIVARGDLDEEAIDMTRCPNERSSPPRNP